MSRYRLRRLEISSETELPEVDINPNDRILSADAGLVAGHPTFQLVIASPIPDTQEVNPK